jgi:hypothetical protein
MVAASGLWPAGGCVFLRLLDLVDTVAQVREVLLHAGDVLPCLAQILGELLDLALEP